jgi:hypothetical protein
MAAAAAAAVVSVRDAEIKSRHMMWNKSKSVIGDRYKGFNGCVRE